ncbi:MAG: PQQ-binding-like beta-propeller repeat protein [Pirellulaceae bacterium]
MRFFSNAVPSRFHGGRMTVAGIDQIIGAALLAAVLLVGPGPVVNQVLAQHLYPAKVDPLDWTFWRGPSYNGTSHETGLIDDWDPRGGEGSNVSWKRDDLGGRSTPIVMNGKLYLLARAEPETPREGERVLCLDAVTGKTIWENRFNVFLSDVPDTRVGWSSVCGDPQTGYVYALGVCGYFQCLEGATGKVVWSVSMHERFGLLSTYGGRTNFPVICDDLVIISAIVIGWGDMAKPAHRFVGFDKRTGEIVWFNGTRPLPYDTTYSSPTVTTLKGQKALVFGSGDGDVWAIQPRTGQPIWNYSFSRRGLNVAPLVVGDRVFSGHSEENTEGTAMGAIVAIDATGKGNVTKTHELWKIPEMMMGKSSPIYHEGRLYCFDDRAKLHVLDAKTGEPVAKRIALGTVMRPSPLLADGKIYICTANGRWYILKPDADKGVTKLKYGRLPRGEGCHASPICSHGRIYLHTTEALYCLEDKSKDRDDIAFAIAAGAETSVADDQAVAHVQLVPADALLRPGQVKQYKVRLFNQTGQFLKQLDSGVEFAVQGSGTIDGSGKYQAAAEAVHSATVVTARVGELTGKARARIVPDLPWNFTFDELNDPPVTWVGARYRHVVREKDGSNVMVKITTIPKGTRSRCWFGHSELSNYTIEADVQGAVSNDKLPDIGLIGQGYTMDLQGENQRLQIRSWVPQLRMAKTIDFSWEPNKWYHMKFRTAVEDGKAVLRGKVWVRGEKEPSAWTIEATDAVPNRSGSPGLFGNAKDAEIYLDNIQVSEN